MVNVMSLEGILEDLFEDVEHWLHLENGELEEDSSIKNNRTYNSKATSGDYLLEYSYSGQEGKDEKLTIRRNYEGIHFRFLELSVDGNNLKVLYINGNLKEPEPLGGVKNDISQALWPVQSQQDGKPSRFEAYVNAKSCLLLDFPNNKESYQQQLLEIVKQL